MFADFPPERENTSGARWNPPEVPAIYASLTREVALAEAEYYIGLQSLPPTAKRTMYQVSVVLNSVVDLRDAEALSSLGITEELMESLDYAPCQRVGGAVEWLDNDGLLIPSVRSAGSNLVIYPNKQSDSYTFKVIDSEVL